LRAIRKRLLDGQMIGREPLSLGELWRKPKQGALGLNDPSAPCCRMRGPRFTPLISQPLEPLRGRLTRPVVQTTIHHAGCDIFVTTLVDVTGLVIYFAVAAIILRGTLG
jgi:hypothetical protein